MPYSKFLDRVSDSFVVVFITAWQKVWQYFIVDKYDEGLNVNSRTSLMSGPRYNGKYQAC